MNLGANTGGRNSGRTYLLCSLKEKVIEDKDIRDRYDLYRDGVGMVET